MQTKDETKAKIFELSSESEHGSWEFWSDSKNKTKLEAIQIIESISELVNEKKIFPIEHESVKNQSYKPADFDIDRLKNEVEKSMSSDIDPMTSYWFLATDKN